MPQRSGVSRARETVRLGSDLRSPAASGRWYCTGAGADSPPCSFVLTRLTEVDRDAVGLQFSVGAYGSARYSDGTSLERWSPPLGSERRPSDSGEGL